jgi:hypothetical protein
MIRKRRLLLEEAAGVHQMNLARRMVLPLVNEFPFQCYFSPFIVVNANRISDLCLPAC